MGHGQWRRYADSIKTITIEDGVTCIYNGAFRDCINLQSVEIGSGVTSIGNDAFYGCNSLESVTIPNSVTSIGNWAFRDCSSLASITIPDSVTSIGSGAFQDCTGVQRVEIGSGVTSIDNDAFVGTEYYNNRDNWTNGVLYVGEYLIKAQDSISGNYNVNKGTKLIADDAFEVCRSLESVTIPDSVTIIGSGAFSYCESLASITIPDNVTSIGSGAFVDTEYYNNGDNWTNGVLYIDEYLITAQYSISGNYNVNKGTKLIADGAFYNCYSLESITIPDSVTSIGCSAFENCTKLSSVEIGSGVTSIGDSAFEYCDSLTSVTIPDSVTIIGDDAFSWCDSLESVELGSSVTSIGYDAFYSCSLKSITIPDSVTSIGHTAFAGCNLQSIEIGSGLTSIGGGAFLLNTAIKSITVDDNNNCYSSDSYGVLYNKDKTAIIQYPCGNARSSFVIPDSVKSISNHTFMYSMNLNSVTIPDGVTSIGAYAFCYCVRLRSIKIPQSVTSIGDVAFAGCTNLKSAAILNPECEIIDIEAYTFEEQTVIHGYENSTAQQYAENKGLQFTVHKADSETVVRGATCTKAGLKVYKCTVCGEIVSTEEIPTKGEHTPREAVKEREIAATCSSAGSYDMVVYCDVCGEEISRITYTTDKLQHTDNNDDGVCDECGKTIPVDTTGCDCVCHRVEKIPKVIYKILRAFWRLFKINKKCKCGTYHWIL